MGAAVSDSSVLPFPKDDVTARMGAARDAVTFRPSRTIRDALTASLNRPGGPR